MGWYVIDTHYTISGPLESHLYSLFVSIPRIFTIYIEIYLVYALIFFNSNWYTTVDFLLFHTVMYLHFVCPVVKLKNQSEEIRSRLTVHSLLLQSQKSFRENEVCTTLGLFPQEEGEVVLPVIVR